MSGNLPKCADVGTFDLFALYFWNCLNPPFSGLLAFRRPKLRFVHFPSVRRVPDRLKNDFAVGFGLQIEKESAKVAPVQLLLISNGCFTRLKRNRIQVFSRENFPTSETLGNLF